jgi:diguanylate cyclase (GGDEF)-like protein/PAS domain S-box-containing protein
VSLGDRVSDPVRVAGEPLDALEAAVERMDEGVVVVDEHVELLLMNPAAARLLGEASGWIIGRERLRNVRVTRPDGVTPLRAWELPLQQLLLGEPECSIDLLIQARDGARTFLTLTARTLEGRGGGAVLTVHDRTEVQLREEAIREAEQRFQLTFENAPVGLALVGVGTRQGAFLQVNAALCDLIGRSGEELLRMSLPDIAHGPDDREAIRRLISGETPSASAELQLAGADGVGVWVHAHTSVLSSGPEHSRYAILHAEDFRVRRRYEQELRHLADHDPLTGLLNRRRFHEAIASHRVRCARFGADGAIVLLDLDGFKDVNDTLGHGAGDDLLRATARILSERVRPGEVLARLGGDEFAVLMPVAEPAEARAFAVGLVDTIAAHTGRVGPGTPTLRATAGVAMFAGEPLSGRDVLAEADVALYEAKEASRGGVVLFTPAGQQQRIAERLWWTEQLGRAVDGDGFTLFRQPIFEYAADGVTAYELLLRMIDRAGQLASPDRFLPVAEQIGLMPAIDLWVVRQAIAELRAMPGDAHLFVNLSAASLVDGRLVEALRDMLADQRIDPGRLTLEITETAAIAHIEWARTLATRLRALGCRLALDDFGAGFASFRYLKHLPVDVVKIDGEFIRDLERDATSQAVVRALVQTARAVGSTTIAEYVENRETFELLRSLGVDAAQGFHIGAPAPLAIR